MDDTPRVACSVSGEKEDVVDMAGADVIMSQTLPTVVSMGVTSRAIDTTMGRQGRRRTATRAAKSKVGNRAVHIGKRGGKYIMKKGRRIYI